MQRQRIVFSPAVFLSQPKTDDLQPGSIRIIGETRRWTGAALLHVVTAYCGRKGSITAEAHTKTCKDTHSHSHKHTHRVTNTHTHT